MEGGVGPSTSSSHSRPIRASSRFYYNNNHSSSSPAAATAAFTGRVRRWEKKWVHVSSSQPSTTKNRKQSNAPPNTSKSTLLCKWTPLSRPPATADGGGDERSGELPRRRFRYTPVEVHEEQKKLIVKRVSDTDESGEANQSTKRLAIDADNIYGMLDINHDLMGANQEPSKNFLAPHSSSRSHFDLGIYLENENKGGQLATN